MQRGTLEAAAAASDAIVNEVVVDAPPGVVFALLADITQMPVWFPTVRAATWDHAPPYGKGSERTVTLVDVTVKERFLAYEPGERFAFEITSMTLPIARWLVEDLRLEALPEGRTKLTWRVAFEVRWWLRPARALVVRKFGPQFRDAAASLAVHAARARAVT